MDEFGPPDDPGEGVGLEGDGAPEPPGLVPLSVVLSGLGEGVDVPDGWFGEGFGAGEPLSEAVLGDGFLAGLVLVVEDF